MVWYGMVWYGMVWYVCIYIYISNLMHFQKGNDDKAIYGSQQLGACLEMGVKSWNVWI
jgi:hypothetical protein